MMVPRKVSRPGEYSSYSEKIYTEVIRNSRYLYIRGNNLAIDIYRPGRNGVAVDEPYPAILQNKRYQRRGIFTDFNLINDLLMIFGFAGYAHFVHRHYVH